MTTAAVADTADLAEMGTAPERVTAAATWRAIGCECRVVVTDPAALDDARLLLAGELGALDLAASRFRGDSELSQLAAAAGRPTAVSPLLAELLRVAFDAAARTAGAVDPTLGQALVDCGYDLDAAQLPAARAGRIVVRPRARWTAVRLDGNVVTMPPGMRLDLGATAKAHAADRAADAIGAALGCGVLVSLGGDVAVRGNPPAGGWTIRVQDRPQPLEDTPDGPAQTVAITGGGLATSSTAARRWVVGATECHHLLDPWTGMPAVTPWRTVSAAAPTCLAANVATTAAIVLAEHGLADLRTRGLAARLVTSDGAVTRIGGWPA